MKKNTVLQVCVAFVLCSRQAVIGSPVDCPDQETAGTSCTISLEKLLERAVQHAELIHRISEESKLLFDEMLISFGVVNLHISEGTMCSPKSVPVPMSKTEIQQISDKWLLHSVLILVQFWINPLVDVQASLMNYENVPSALLNRSKWMSTKIISLEQGILVLIRQILGEGGLVLESPEDTSDRFVSSDVLETVRRDYSVIYCFRKDAHKIQTFLKLLKCRQVDKENCSFF
ncbi:somatolactin beta [Sinocyclocheilus rhinocerous]|uniref:somatolactin beta n=1 Tax=Sinocyclocheilus rhinocerous TaxID=307959 RepID=UPI0007B8563B|nr:PREDICTED: somatolactin [Sinocyclocheilus rhinocerous]